MSRVHALNSATQNYSVKFLEFTRLKKRVRNALAVFFEGEDEKYYSVRLNSLLPNINWYGFNCGGKKAVLTLRNAIRENQSYSESSCMFFVDSDFDNNIQLKRFPDIYITPCYSVENFYVSESCLQRILKAEFNITEFGEEYECYQNAVSSYAASSSSYMSIIKRFNVIIKSQRELESISQTETRLDIDDIDFESLIKVDLTECHDLYSKKRISQIFPSLDDDLDLSAGENYFMHNNDISLFRGKQNLEFFRKYICHLKEDRCKKKNRRLFKNKKTVKLNLTKGNTLSEISQYADTPQSLIDYIMLYRIEDQAVA